MYILSIVPWRVRWSPYFVALVNRPPHIGQAIVLSPVWDLEWSVRRVRFSTWCEQPANIHVHTCTHMHMHTYLGPWATHHPNLSNGSSTNWTAINPFRFAHTNFDRIRSMTLKRCNSVKSQPKSAIKRPKSWQKLPAVDWCNRCHRSPRGCRDIVRKRTRTLRIMHLQKFACSVLNGSFFQAVCFAFTGKRSWCPAA